MLVSQNSFNEQKDTFAHFKTTALVPDLVESIIKEAFSAVTETLFGRIISQYKLNSGFYRDFRSFSCVCKAWHQVANKIPFWLIHSQGVKLETLLRHNNNATLSFFKHNKSDLKLNASDFTNIYTNGNWGWQTSDRIALIDSYTFCEKVVIYDEDIKSANVFKTFSFENVTTLKFHNRLTYAGLVSFSPKFPKVEVLNLEVSRIQGIEFFDAIAKYFPKVTTLDLTCNYTVHAHYCVNWLQENNNLIFNIANLTMGGQYFTENCVPYLIKGLPNLKTLKIDCKHLTGENFEFRDNNDIKTFNCLKTLDFTSSTLTEKGLKVIINTCPNLKNLKFAKYPHPSYHPTDHLSFDITETAIAMLSSLRSLKSLEISIHTEIEKKSSLLTKFLPRVAVEIFPK